MCIGNCTYFHHCLVVLVFKISSPSAMRCLVLLMPSDRIVVLLPVLMNKLVDDAFTLVSCLDEQVIFLSICLDLFLVEMCVDVQLLRMIVAGLVRCAVLRVLCLNWLG